MEFECFTLVFLSIANCMIFFQTLRHCRHSHACKTNVQQMVSLRLGLRVLRLASYARGLVSQLPGTGQSRL